MTQAGETCTYTYTNTGNISKVIRNGVATTYTYDKLGQLTRVNDPSETSTDAPEGTTWVYTYDRGGNILNKKRYAYAESTLGTVLETITYGYGVTDWKDQLTSYNGQTITYDAVGNPLNDGTWTYTWEHGRQLKQMETLDRTTEAHFSYNHEGIRVLKTVNGVQTFYTLHGDRVVYQAMRSVRYAQKTLCRPHSGGCRPRQSAGGSVRTSCISGSRPCVQIRNTSSA